MSITTSDLLTDVDSILQEGVQVRFKYYTLSGADAGYDDDVALTQSGNDFFTSGLVQPVGPNDQYLLQQGLLNIGDVKLYVRGTVEIPNDRKLFKVGVGSPTILNEYGVGEAGIQNWPQAGSPVYRRLFLQLLPNGSLLGE